MSETLEELKAIRDGAPYGTASIFGNTYIDGDGRFYSDGVWLDIDGCIEIKQQARSLSDIKRIIELVELNQNMHLTVSGYLFGDDWTHWNKFNAGKFKP